MNNRFFLIAILIYLSVQVLGQDVVPRQAPIDNMSSFEDSINNDKVTILNSQRFQLLLILLKVGSGLIMRRLRMYLKHTRFEWIIRNIFLILSIGLWINIMI